MCATLVLVGLLVSCGGDDDGPDQAAPGTGAQSADCPLDGGQVKVFYAYDLAGNAGALGPAIYEGAQPLISAINAEGGILGCDLVVDVEDEGFPDVQTCLRAYRQAVSSGDYTVFFGPFNSACMLAVPTVTNPAKKILIGQGAADHQPYLDDFQPYNFAALPTTFLEARATAKYIADNTSWKRIAILTPNYAYGQDYATAFEEYFLRLVPDGEIVTRQFPPFGERNFQPYLNPILAGNVDAVVGGQYGPDILTLWNTWIDQGLSIPSFYLVTIPDTLENVTSAEDIPEGAHGYTRGFWTALQHNPEGQKVMDLYQAEFGSSDSPVPNTFIFAYWSALKLMKALAEETGSFEPDEWVEIVEQGDFTYESPYHDDATAVSPITHMADACAQVGPLTFDESLPVPGAFAEESELICMSDVLDDDEAREIVGE